jgi:MFS family permease
MRLQAKPQDAPTEHLSKFQRAFQHPDFRLLWLGAFFSFMGSWIQNVGQGFLVYELTGSKEKLALISFCSMIPVTFIGPFAGSLVDTMNKKTLLVWTQILLGLSAVFLAISTYFKFVTLEQMVVVALLNGVVSCFEMPARQMAMTATVPKEDLPVAIPFMGMTFNLARVLGPAVGGILLANIGVASCYTVNALSFLALIFAAIAIKADLSPKTERASPILDLLKEGYLYTMREPRLRTLFWLETWFSLVAIFYLPQIPALTKDVLKLNETWLGWVYFVFGLGSFVALLVNTKLADLPIKGLIIRSAVTLSGCSLITLSLSSNVPVVFLCLFSLGMSNVLIFNSCNALFQMIAPEHLRGRVLSMHIWALSGVGPFGVYPFGWIAEKNGLGFALLLSGVLTLLLASWAWMQKVRLESQ